MSEITVHHGDSRAVLKTLADESVHSCVTDAPYALTSILKRFGAAGAAPAKSGKTGHGKLNLALARSMRAKRARGAKLADLALKFGVSLTTASVVCSGGLYPEPAL